MQEKSDVKFMLRCFTFYVFFVIINDRVNKNGKEI